MTFRAILSLVLGLGTIGLTCTASGEKIRNEEARQIEPVHLRKILELPREAREISSITVSPNNDLIAYSTDRPKRSRIFRRTMSGDEAQTTIRIWSRQSGQIQATLEEPDGHAFGTLFFTQDGRNLGIRSGFSSRYFKLWDIASGQLRVAIQQSGEDWDESAISPDGNFLAMSSRVGTTRMWSLSNGAVRMTMHEYVPRQGSWLTKWLFSENFEPPFLFVNQYFSPDSSLLAVASNTKRAELWDTGTGRLRYQLEGSDRLSDWSVHSSDFFSPDGSVVATTFAQRDRSGQLTANGVTLSRAADGSRLRFLDHACSPARFSPDGKKLATSLVHWKDDGTKEIMAEIWDVETGKLLKRLVDPKNSLDQILWGPDGRTLATSSGKTYTLTLWDVETGHSRAQVRLVRHHGFDIISEYISDQDSLFFSPDSRYLIAANQKSFRIIEVGSGKVLEKIEGLSFCRFLVNGQLLTLSHDRKGIVLWEIVA